MSKRLPLVAIIGRPNIGKSSLFNVVVGYNKAIVMDEAGTTRDRVYEKCDWRDKEFILVDTAGIEPPEKDDEIELNMQRQVTLAIADATVILFGLDAETQLFPEDRQILQTIYKSGKPFLVFVNKADNQNKENNAIAEFSELGETLYYISANNKRNIHDFLNILHFKMEEVREEGEGELTKHHDADINVAIVGKPNVGKSSLINVFLGKEEAIVSEVAGTTRDTIDRTMAFNGKHIRFVDTAGMRKKSKVSDGIEYYSVLRALRTVEASDIVMLVIDATHGPTKQDMTLSEIALKHGKSIVLVVNKWDLFEKNQSTLPEYETYLRNVFRYMKWVPIIFTSAKEKLRTFRLLEIIQNIHTARNTELKTSKLNKIIQLLVLKRPPQARNSKIRHPKIYYATQTGTAPPAFTLFVNDPKYFHNSYTRYLRNQLREHFDFYGTPINIIYRERR